MPRGNKTGPDGMGPMTGRRMGSCGGNVNQGSPDNTEFRMGFGRGLRNGFGRGFNQSSGRGFRQNYEHSIESESSNKESIERELSSLKTKMEFLESELKKLE